MKKLPLLKTYIIVFVIIFMGGTIWSIINGYQYFCEGLKACDQSGEVLSWNVFFKRKAFVLLWVATMSAFITFMLVKDRGKGEGGTE